MTSPSPVFLGGAWGFVVTARLFARAKRRAVRARVEVFVGTAPVFGPPVVCAPVNATVRVAAPPWRGGPLARAVAIVRSCIGPFARVARAVPARQRARRERTRLEAELPVAVDLLAVAVGAGCTPYVAVEVAARWAPAGVGERLRMVRRACVLGASFADALSAVGSADPAFAPLASALTVSDRTGAPVSEQLARLASEQRAAARHAAETRARAVPVRLLFPLVFLVLPAFGLLTVVPALLVGLSHT